MGIGGMDCIGTSIGMPLLIPYCTDRGKFGGRV